jgi:lipoate-protein ligase A
MAADEALLEWAARLSRPILRFYRWQDPGAATFGYFQRYAEVAQSTPLRPLIRRPTGGGIVPHDRDWTYSLVFPPSHPWYSLRATESYRHIHQWIRETFRQMQVAAELSPQTRKDILGQCFLGAEQFDVLSQGKKIAGAAQRRNRAGLLIQGSIQPSSPAWQREQYEYIFCQRAEDQWQVQWQDWCPHHPLQNRIRELIDTKYALAAYNQKR